MANSLGYSEITIQAVGMDHSQACLNAAKAAGAACVVDCSVHVDRGMFKNRGRLKKGDYLETALQHVRMLVSITDRETFDYGAQVVLSQWKTDGEEEFADWFESVYLAEDWDGGSFFAGAGGVPGSAKDFYVARVTNVITGIIHHNQCDESLFRSIKRNLKMKASVEHFFEHSIPEMLHHLAINYSVSAVCRGTEDQITRVRDGHIHRDVLEKALLYCQAFSSNSLRVWILIIITTHISHC